MTGAHTAPQGRTRIDIGGSIGRLLLIPTLPMFFANYLDVHLDLGIGDRTVDLIGDNVDCAIRCGTVHGLSRVSRLLVSCPLPTDRHRRQR